MYLNLESDSLKNKISNIKLFTGVDDYCIIYT